MSTSSLAYLRNAVGRLVRLAYIVSVCIMTAGLILVVLRVGFSADARTCWAVVCALPSVAFAISLYLYERHFAVPLLTAGFYFRSVLVSFMLLIPSASLVVRFLLPEYLEPYVAVFAGALLLAFVGAAFSEVWKRPGNMGPFWLMLSHMQEVMWSAWSVPINRLSVVSKEVFDSAKLQEVRARYYADKTSVELFQQTITCPTYDADVVVSLLDFKCIPKQIRVLDIGPGEGRFSGRLFKSLADADVHLEDVTFVDPIDWSSEYKRNLSCVVDPKRITAIKSSYEDFNEPGIFDLLVASHSLYARWDKLKREGEDAAREANRLLGLLKPGGMGILLMASKRGMSYHFKGEAIEGLFGGGVEDVTAESLQGSFRTGTVRCIKTVDNLIDLSSCLEDDDKGGDQLIRWLSYFLRYDVSAIRTADREVLLESLRRYVLRLDSLPEAEIERYVKCEFPVLTRSSKVLPHKTSVILVSA